MIWAATQELLDDDVVLSRGLSVDREIADKMSKGTMRINANTVGHWSESFDTAEDFSRTSNYAKSSLLLTVKIPKEAAIFHYKLWGEYSEKEIVPIFTKNLKILSTTTFTGKHGDVVSADLIFQG